MNNYTLVPREGDQGDLYTKQGHYYYKDILVEENCSLVTNYNYDNSGNYYGMRVNNIYLNSSDDKTLNMDFKLFFADNVYLNDYSTLHLNNIIDFTSPYTSFRKICGSADCSSNLQNIHLNVGTNRIGKSLINIWNYTNNNDIDKLITNY